MPTSVTDGAGNFYGLDQGAPEDTTKKKLPIDEVSD
jgi:hypothetical protein